MNSEAWLTVAVCALTLTSLATRRLATDTALLAALATLVLAGVLPVDEALGGFAHPAVILVAALLVVSQGLSDTGALAWAARRFLGRARTPREALLRTLVPVSALSAFINNTPLVSLTIPHVLDLSRRSRVSPSRLLMPLSFAAMLGGACTLIGTSSNVVISELFVDFAASQPGGTVNAPSGAMLFWWMGAVALPIAVAGIGYLVAFGPRLVPERRPVGSDPGRARRFETRMVVLETSPIVGETLEGAGLRGLPGLFLAHIERAGQRLSAVARTTQIEAHDTLIFVGVLESVIDLRTIPGLVSESEQVDKLTAAPAHRRLVEAVISPRSPLAYRTLKQARFRSRYNAAVIAVHRNGEQILRKIGEIVLQPGDTLLIDTSEEFAEAYRDSDAFYLVSEVHSARPIRHEKAGVALLITAVVIGALATPLAVAPGGPGAVGVALAGAVAMVVSGCTSAASARSALPLEVLLAMAASIGIGRALESTGAATAMATSLLTAVGAAGPHAVLAATVVVTIALTQVISNLAAAVMVFPVAMSLALDLGVSPEPFAVALMIAASCAFLSPVGYQTNLMVQGPGGYHFGDFARVGAPLTAIVVVMTTVLAPAIFPF